MSVNADSKQLPAGDWYAVGCSAATTDILQPATD